jgi:S-adenosyl-L-methionine hydrolase (adenosine-forming)
MRPIVFLSDFGLDDEFVGICHGVIARIAPEARVIDLTHGVPPQDVVRAALILAESVPYMPSDAVFLAVVDPGVGTARRAVAVRTKAGPLLVGPDNGLLSLAWEALEGAEAASAIESADLVLPSASRTFHGRDVFAPAAAHLAAGVPVEDLGPTVDVGGLAVVSVPEPAVEEGRLESLALGIDRFGNVQLNARPHHLELLGLGDAEWLDVRTARRAAPVRRVETFADVGDGEMAVLVDSRGWLALVRNGGSAAHLLGVELGDPVFVEPPG